MIVPYEALPDIRQENADNKIVFTGGCFDLVHEGHVEGLSWRKNLGDILVVGVVSDERVIERKGNGRPIRGEVGRLTVVNAFRAVDYAFMMPLPAEISPTMQVLHTLRPDVFVESYENEHRWTVDGDLFGLLGIEFVIDPLPKQDSTTEIITRINNPALDIRQNS